MTEEKIGGLAPILVEKRGGEGGRRGQKGEFLAGGNRFRLCGPPDEGETP